MKRFWAALAILLSCISAAFAAEPFARATLDGEGTIVPGQQVHIAVDVFAPNFFTSAPQFPLFDLPDAVVTLPDDRAQNLVETVDDVQYSGIRRSYTIVPQVAGTFTLPPLAIDFDYSDDGKTVKGTARLPLTRFTVGEAPGGEGKALPFAARGVTLTQAFDRDPEKLKVGEALVRTVTVFGADTQAMMIPSLDFGQPQGLKVYPKSPAIADGVQGENGTAGSSRVQTVTYVADAAGTFTIPQVSMEWFDLDAHMAKTASLPATVLTVTDVPVPAEGIAPQLQADDSNAGFAASWKRTSAVIAAALCLSGGLGWLGWRLFPRANEWMSAWDAMRRNSEKTLFKQLATSIRKDDAPVVYRRLDVWSRSAGFRSIAGWVSAAGDAHLAREIGALERELFAGTPNRPGFDRAALLNAVANARRTHIETARPRPASHLPELNPS